MAILAHATAVELLPGLVLELGTSW